MTERTEFVVRARGQIGTGLPTDEGSRFADWLLAHFANDDEINSLAELSVDLNYCPVKTLISAFWTAFMNRLYEIDPDYCEAATEITWTTEYDWQNANIARWLAPYKIDEKCITNGVRKLKTPQSVQIGLRPGWEDPVLNVVSAEGDSYSIPISNEAAEVLIAMPSGLPYEG